MTAQSRASRHKFDVVTIADSCVDVVVPVEGLDFRFSQEELILPHNGTAVRMGGSATIFACQAAKLGLRTAVVGAVGHDKMGELVRETLELAGVDTSRLLESERYATGTSIILTRAEGRTILTSPGVIRDLEPADVAWDVVESARHVHLASYFLFERLRSAIPASIGRVKDAGGAVSLDPNWDPSERWDSDIGEVLPSVDIIFANEAEVEAISRSSDLAVAMTALAAMTPTVVVKRGAEGAVAISGSTTISSPALSIGEDFVDPVGAGDSFDAGYVYASLQGMGIESRLRSGVVCGSLSTRAAGGCDGQPDRQTLTAALRDIFGESLR